MSIRKYITLICFSILLVMVSPLYSQQEENSPILRKAVVEYNSLRFTSAILELEKVLEKEPDNVRAQEMMAGSNRNIKNYDEAVYWYGELCKLKNIKPEWALYYAEALANKERYEESEQWYRRFLSMKPADRRASAFSKANLNALSNNKGEFKVTYSSINTDASEYSPMYYKDGLMFVSNRQQKSRFIFQWDKTSYSDLYIVDDLESITEGNPDSSSGDSKAKYVAAFDKERSLISLFSSNKKAEEPGAVPYLLRGKVKSSFHEGPATLLPEGSLMFTRNNYVSGKSKASKTGVNKLKIFTASGPEWDNITSFPYNNNEYSTGHPTISADGKILIFASDMSRGFGGTDLYYCVRTGEGKKWGRPVNLGPRINTEGNEQFPFFAADGRLYFSSTGHPGLGGLDIFEIRLKDLKPIGDPKNLGTDINSSADDFGYVQDNAGKGGFFSSNRRGNDDVYQFTRMAYTVDVKGTLVDAQTGKPLGGSRVIFRHDGRSDTIVTNARGEFGKILAKETDYELSGGRVSYVSNQEYLTTSGITVDSTIRVTLKLNRVENVQQWVMDNCESLKRTFTLNNIYYDLDRADIRNDARKVLDEIAQILKRNPEINIISASHTDSRATDSYNRELSLRRGEEAKRYLISKGIDGSRIQVKYYGKSRLLNACEEDMSCSESEQQVNRRTEFEVVLNGVNLTRLNCNEDQ